MEIRGVGHPGAGITSDCNSRHGITARHGCILPSFAAPYSHCVCSCRLARHSHPCGICLTPHLYGALLAGHYRPSPLQQLAKRAALLELLGSESKKASFQGFWTSSGNCSRPSSEKTICSFMSLQGTRTAPKQGLPSTSS